MDHHSSTPRHQRRGTIAEVAAINVVWPCALGVFGTGLVTQNFALALQGLALFFATYFYTLVRLYQLGSSDIDEASSDPVTLRRQIASGSTPGR
jgi:hypothetical protein